jgi:hypothetical protein
MLQPWMSTKIKIQYIIQGFQTFHGNKVLWHIDPMLGNDCETRQQTLLGSGPRASMQVVLDAVFSVWSDPRLYNSTDRVRLSMETWCERCNIKINEDKTRGIYFSRSRRPPESHLTLNGWDISFVNSAKYIGVIFDRKITWRLHIEMIEAKAFRTCIRAYSLFKSGRLSTNI